MATKWQPIFSLFYMKEHEKISRLTFYCNALSLLVPKLFAKMAKYKLLTQHKLQGTSWLSTFIEYKTEHSSVIIYSNSIKICIEILHDKKH